MNEKKLTEISSPKQWKNLPISKLLEFGYPVYGANGIIGYYNEYNHEKSTLAITCRGATCGSIHLTKPKSYITSNAMALDDLDETICNIKYLALYLKYRGLNQQTPQLAGFVCLTGSHNDGHASLCGVCHGRGSRYCRKSF
jgi:type I restriction enzyme, S subunit